MALADKQTNLIPRIEWGDLLDEGQPTFEESVARATNAVVSARQDGHITAQEATVLLKWIQKQRQELAIRQIVERTLSHWPFTPRKRRLDDYCDCCDRHTGRYR